MKNAVLPKYLEQRLFRLLETKAEEITFVSPQNLGFATVWYKKVTAPLKTTPWKVFLPLSFLSALLAEIMLGRWTVKIVSVLQEAF